VSTQTADGLNESHKFETCIKAWGGTEMCHELR